MLTAMFSYINTKASLNAECLHRKFTLTESVYRLYDESVQLKFKLNFVHIMTHIFNF